MSQKEGKMAQLYMLVSLHKRILRTRTHLQTLKPHTGSDVYSTEH